MHRWADQDLILLRRRHQPRGQVDRIPHHRVFTPATLAFRTYIARKDMPIVDADALTEGQERDTHLLQHSLRVTVDVGHGCLHL